MTEIHQLSRKEREFFFNKDGYSTYCKDYKEYQNWVEHRNETRYHQTIDHGKNYDAKNMMHVFRLLSMAKEIGLTQTVHVFRHDREKLLNIKHGHFEYEVLVKMAEKEIAELDEIYQHSPLPEKPNRMAINDLLVSIRKEFCSS